MLHMRAPIELLPDPLPAEPLQMAAEWLAEAAGLNNPNAMTLATCGPEGRPAARIVLCKDIVPQPGYVVFYTNYRSRKGRELAANPRAAAVLYWDTLRRQVRIDGLIELAPAADSDAYFASRALESQIGAWASAQSEPIGSREQLVGQVAATAGRFGITLDERTGEAQNPSARVPRPPHWGGYRLWAESVELWVEGKARIHDRARWSRVLTRRGTQMEPGAWSATRLQP
jgi:pyridoxamine 5'-phosphate oxidase